MANLIRITLKARDQAALGRLLGQHKLDLACGHRSVDERGNTLQDAVVTRDMCTMLQKFDAHVEVMVDEELNRTLSERQREVGSGDRFLGGAVPPRGIGKKE